MGHGLLVVDATYSLRQHDADVNSLDLVALHLLKVMRHSVGYNHLVKKLKNEKASDLRTIQITTADFHVLTQNIKSRSRFLSPWN